MQKYYFDVYDGSKVARDDHGESFDGVQDAADQAADLLFDFARESLPSGHGRDYGVAVRDGTSSDVYRAALIFWDSYPDPKRPGGSPNAYPVLIAQNPVDLIRKSRETRATTKRILHQIRETATALGDAMRQATEAVKLTRMAVTDIV